MVKISRDDKCFSRLKTSTLTERKIRERYDLQEFIWNSPEAFCQELGQDMLIFGKEVQPSSAVGDRIDLLAIDGDGLPVILELKRGSDRLQLFQAISYAGMVTDQKRERLLALQGVDAARAAGIDGFLQDSETEEQVNQEPRIILVAEAFDYEVLVGAKWLYEKYEVDIACVRVSMAYDETNDAEYLAFTQVFPTPEIEEIAKSRRRRNLSVPGVPGPSTTPTTTTEADVLEMADDRQVRPLVEICRHLGKIWDEKLHHDRIGYSLATDSGWRSLCKVFITAEKMGAPLGQLDVKVATKNLAEVTAQDHDVIRATLAEHHPQRAAYAKYCIIRLSTVAEAEALVDQLKEWWDLRPQPVRFNVPLVSTMSNNGGAMYA